MARFEVAIETVLRHEGFYSNDAADPGGATKYGVSLRFLQSLGEDLGDVDRDGDIDIEDIKALTLKGATAIYRREWWDKYLYAEIRDESLATKVLDLSINMGAGQAHKLVQAAANRAKPGLLTVDGKLGSKSFLAINSLPPEILLRLIADEAAGFYVKLTLTRIRNMGVEEGGKYLRGWIRRAYALI